ncbi:cytidylate kinase family protein [Candidatus Micrarchaeota archaeon]|jgi:cytidylate kinase|nr:cytidylate kinase family protein [Candidatus Micrarchaeota archaeon]
MIICITGFTATGKDTTADYIAKKLNLPRVNYTFKDMAKERGIDLIELQKIASQDDGEIDKEFDKKQVEEAQRLKREKGGCVVSTWIAPWMIKNVDFKIYLYATEEERIKRVLKRGDRQTKEEAKRYLKEKDWNNIDRYKKYYDIDIRDISNFDYVLDGTHLSIEEQNEKVLTEIKKKFDL